MVPESKTCRKIRLKCGANTDSNFQCHRNLVEKVNGRKIESAGGIF